MNDEMHGRLSLRTRVVDACGLIALAGAASALSAAWLTENDMGMGVFMGLFIALIAGSVVLFGSTRVRRSGPVPGQAAGAD